MKRLPKYGIPLFFLLSFQILPLDAAESVALSSPDRTIALHATFGKKVTWQLSKKGQTILLPSSLGLVFRDQKPFGELKVLKKRTRSWSRTWENRLYKKRRIEDHANELTVELQEKESPKRKLNLIFRAYDQGVALRYQIPAQRGFENFTLLREKTSFVFEQDFPSWLTVYKDYKTSQEEPFYLRSIRSVPADQLVGAPAVIDLGQQKAAIFEADLTDWSGMFLKVPSSQPASGTVLETDLSPRLDGKGVVVSSAPRETPWRVVLLGDTEVDLVNNSDLILNLNPPPEGGDSAFAWVQPGVTGWDWWYKFKTPASTESTIEQIDFAAKMGWPYHTIDGGWYRPVKGEGATMTQSSVSLDFPKIFQHAKEKGIGIWLWGYWSVLERDGVDKVFDLFSKWGVKGVKIDFMNRQDQEMVRWYEKVVRAAAKRRIMVNFHGAFKPTGMNRTWPNQITREGVLGNEMCKFNALATPQHTATIPFTRYLLGPGDYTPGSFNNRLPAEFIPQFAKGADELANDAAEIGTRAHALALCIVYDSPLTTLCDSPRGYRDQPGLEALRNLPTVWENTIALDGKIGEFYVVARQGDSGDWYLAAITDHEIQLKQPLSFLPEGEYTAIRYEDCEENRRNARAIKITRERCTQRSALSLKLLPAGGAFIRIMRNDNTASSK